jgi:hypothetical protein
LDFIDLVESCLVSFASEVRSFFVIRNHLFQVLVDLDKHWVDVYLKFYKKYILQFDI